MKTLILSVALWVTPVVAQTVVTAPHETARLKLTIGQSNGALVIDRRAVNLTAGQQVVRFAGLPATLASTGDGVQARLSGPAPVAILEQKARHESSAKEILALYEGKTVAIVQQDGKQISGVLARTVDGWMLETKEGLILNPSGTFLLPRLPDGPILTPSLEWLINAGAAGAYTAEAFYGIAVLNWNARYRATLIKQPMGDRLAFQAWIDVSNGSDISLREAETMLHQGNINNPGLEFPLPRPLTIARQETRQLHYAGTEVPASTEILADFSRGNYLQPARTLAPSSAARLKNDAASGLGLPLPVGNLTTWQQSADGVLRKASEQTLEWVPVGAEFSLALAEMKEISVTRTLVATRKLNPRLSEHNFSFLVENRSKQPITVLVRDSLPENGKITEATLEPEVNANNMLRFKVEVPPAGKQSFEITVQVTT
jgi:hypothetical protein